MKTPCEIAECWMTAFNSKNLEALLGLYDEDAQHFSPKLKLARPETQGLIKGKEAMMEWWADAFKRLPTLSYEPTRFTANENRVFMEYIRRVAGELDMNVAELLDIENGLICFSRVYHG